MNITKHFLTALSLLYFSINSLAGINTWTQCSGTSGYGVIGFFTIDTTTTGRIYAGTNGVLISNDYGTTWTFSSLTSIATIDGAAISIAVNPKSTNEVYICINNGLWIAKSTTYGYGNWVSITDGSISAPTVPNLLFDPENVGRMYVGSEPFGLPIYRSDDTGYTWTPSYSGITTDQGTSILIMHPSIHNRLFAGAAASPGIFESDDGATTWHSLPLYLSVQSLAIDPTNYNNIYAGSATGGFASSFDGGSTWNICTDTTITNAVINSVIVNPLNPEIIYVVTAYVSGGVVFKSKDQGNTWTAMTTGLPLRPALTLAYDTITRTLFAGTVKIDSETHARGIWMYQDTDLTTAVEDWEKYDW